MTPAEEAAPLRRPWWLSWPGLALGAALALAWRGSDGNLELLLGPDARRTLAQFAGGFWPPAHGPAFLAGLWRPLAETAAIGLLGVAGALLIAVPLALLATSPEAWAGCGARPGWRHRLAHRGARGLLALLRSIPELVWALLLVRAVGLGPAAGVLAIAVAYGGVIGRVFADILESTPRAAGAALGSAGASPLAAMVLGVGAQARSVLLSYSLYRLDCALRASAVLGLVGAGGIGQQVELALKMLAYDEVAGLLLALFALVLAVDLASAWLRRRLGARGSLFPPTGARLAVELALAAAGVATLLGADRLLDLRLGRLLGERGLASMAGFVRSMFPPDLSPGLLAAVVPAVGETLAISVLGTALAAVAGLGLALVAARPQRLGVDGARAGWLRAGGAALALAARALLDLGRTLPELLWALALVFAVGLGPFAGALALGLHTTGVLGRLYAETLEEVPAAPVAALRAAGAGPLGLLAAGVLPQAGPQLLAYTLYRWEVNIRASAVLGVVGAGGLGQRLYLSLSIFDHPTTLTLLGAILALVLAVDAFSGWLRNRLPATAGLAAVRARAE